MKLLEISNLEKRFSNGAAVFENISLTILDGEVVTVVGPSGCGKTTLLNLIANLDKPTSGLIEFQTNKNPRIGYVLQDALLLPWRTLYENANLGLEILDRKQAQSEGLRDSLFSVFDLAASKTAYPIVSSGGMKQRVALIRTLITSPSFLLLDEPFSNLDFDIKLKVQKHILHHHSQNETTILLVTHDIEDAIALSDRVIVLSEKPTEVKAEIPIHLGTKRKDPVEARKSPKFREYFIEIWDQLKYLDNND